MLKISIFKFITSRFSKDLCVKNETVFFFIIFLLFALSYCIILLHYLIALSYCIILLHYLIALSYCIILLHYLIALSYYITSVYL